MVLSKKSFEKNYDLIVAGGGLAGVLAAVSASREGLKVLLVEKYGFLGGMATAGLVYPFMSYVENGSKAVANAGLFADLLERLYRIGGTNAPDSRHYRQEFMKIALDHLAAEYGVDVLFHSLLTSVEFCGRRVKSAVISTISGNIEIGAPLYIDATGNADLIALAGLDYHLGREEDGLCQPLTLNFRLANVDTERFDKKAANELYLKLQSEGKLRNPRENILVFKYADDNILHFNTTRYVGIDPTDVWARSRAEVELREQMLEMYLLLKNNIDGMQNSALIESGAEAGIRESRRIDALYTLTKDDVVGVRKFPDRIARGTYMIDIHNPSGSGTEIIRIKENDYYTIPYRSLIPRQADNIIVAGRSIGADHVAMSSLRIMPITSCIGEAAGAAAYLASRDGVPAADINVPELQRLLVSHGALI
ncbi:MAG TPA: FAD-dependent oxidoreductase [Clostridiales bacterium]|jgi:hypothetical protein|nr:FAD-dependent oxidoreductase [Clostridiales bacterium]